jgi:hypothetical protein
MRKAPLLIIRKVLILIGHLTRRRARKKKMPLIMKLMTYQPIRMVGFAST